MELTNPLAHEIATPDDKQCIELASLSELTRNHWGKLTGVDQSDEGDFYVVHDDGIFPRKWDEDFIRVWPKNVRHNMRDDNYRQPLIFPCTPQRLLEFVDASDYAGFSFDVPDAFRQAVNAKSTRQLVGDVVPSKTPENIAPAKKWEDPLRLEFTARKIGEEWMDKTTPKPGVDAIAKYVERELKTQNKLGPRGDYWSWKTIKREALTGITGRKANGKK